MAIAIRPTTKPLPKIERIDARIGTLQRRQEHLERRLGSGNYAASPSAEFDRAEVEALKAAVTALEWIRDQR